jgi:hypothetical protein
MSEAFALLYGYTNNVASPTDRSEYISHRLLRHVVGQVTDKDRSAACRQNRKKSVDQALLPLKSASA